jgi:glutaconate CoA-transferase subunit A
MNKLIPIEEAVNLVKPGSMLALGGMTLYRRPMAFIYALLRRVIHEKDNHINSALDALTLMSFTASIESDLLVGAGIISKVRTCYFGLEIFGLAPMFTYYANLGKLEIIEETETSLALGLRAQSAGISFLPGRAWLGTDLPRLRPDVRTVIDPYNGEELIAFPAIRPNIAVIHCLRADQEGNAQIGNNKAVDEELTLASETVIVTAEEVVPELEKADLVAPLVHAVVHAPRGAEPTSCHPLYPFDGESILVYSEQVSDDISYWRYVRKTLGV